MKIAKDKLLIISFVALVVIGWFVAYTQQYSRNSNAAGNPVTFSLTPSSTSTPPNQNVPITVVINTGDATKKISGLDLTFNATGNISIVSSTVPSPIGGNTSITPTEFVKSITPTTARLSYAFLNNDADLPSSVSFQIVVSGTAAGTGSLAVDLTKSQVVGNITANTFDLPTTTPSTSVTITGGGGLTPTVPAGSPQINVRLSPSTGNQTLNTPFTTSLIIDGQQAGQKVSGIDVKLSVNPSVLKIISVGEPADETGSTTKFTKLTNTFDATAGTIILSYVSIQAESSLPNSAKIDIQLQGIANGTGSVNIVSSQITGNITQNAYAVVTTPASYTIGSGGGTPTVTVTQGPTPTGNPNITPTAIPTVSGSVILNLKLKFQGISRQPASQVNNMKVQVMVAKEGFTSAPQFGTFTADASGIWSGSVGFNDVTPGSGYRIYVKGPKHLQKKICAAQPSETAAGTYRCGDGTINIAAGQNTFDFSRVYLLVGDLPDQSGVQNGVIDSYDTSYIKLNLGSTAATALATADLNLDGIVDTQDYSLVIASLTIKYDEL